MVKLSLFNKDAQLTKAAAHLSIGSNLTYIDAMEIYAKQLLDWYDRHHRVLPWRISPKDVQNGLKPDPYKIWLSEVMLQQTTVEAVKAYFIKFIQKWPRVENLAAASLDDVLKAWAGLGYYSRARNLKACADRVVEDYNGIFPSTINDLKKLPGIGDYTSAAIAAIAFNQNEAVVDGNIERIISRLFCISTPLPAAKPLIREKMALISPNDRPGDFAQAMMDLGASLCSPKRPSCFLCPINSHCQALAQGDPEIYPIKAPKKDKPLRQGAAFILLSKEGNVFLQKRHEKGLLAQMSEVPNYFGSLEEKHDLNQAPSKANWHYSGEATHIFTHFRLEMSVYLAKNIDEQNFKNGWWVAIDNLHDEALPTVMKKIIATALPDAFKIKRAA